MIYIISFLVSSLFLQRYVKYKGKGKKIFWWAAVLVPVTIAALRSKEVGVDVLTYAYPFIQPAQNLTLAGYLEFASGRGINDFAYNIILYICANYLGGLIPLLGILQFITIYCVYKRIVDFKDEAPVAVMSCIYLLLLYNRSLSMMRQCVAMAIIFYGLRYIHYNKKKYLLFVAVAFLFHSSAILGLSYLVILYISDGKLSKIKSILICIALVVAVTYYDMILVPLTKLIFGDGTKYLAYFRTRNTGFVGNWDILYKVLAIVAILIFAKKKQMIGYYAMKNNSFMERKAGDDIFLFCFIVSVFNLVLYFLRRFNPDNYRFALYFQILLFVVIPQVRKRFSKRNRIIVDSFIILSCLLNWYIFMMVGDSYGTLPYAFCF